MLTGSSIPPLPRRRLRSNKEYSPFDLALGLAIEVPVYFDAEERLQCCIKQRVELGQTHEPEEVVIPGLEALNLSDDMETITTTNTTTTTTTTMNTTTTGTTNPHSAKRAQDNLSAQQRRKVKSKYKRFDDRHDKPSKSPSSSHAALSAAKHAKAKSRGKRGRQRTQEASGAAVPKAIHLKRAGQSLSSAIHVPYDATDLLHSKPGWIGSRNAKPHSDVEDELNPIMLGETGMGPMTYTQEEVDKLVGQRGFLYIPWLGVLTIPIVDSKRRIIVLLGGQPRDSAGWKIVTDGTSRLMDNAAQHLNTSGSDYDHRRAAEPYIPIFRGVSFGGGQEEPGNLFCNDANRAATDELMAHEYYIRIVGFIMLLMSIYAPRLLARYQKNKADILAWNKELSWNFEKSCFAACTFNFENVVTSVHLDFGNTAAGLCPITALGDFNPDHGGHLILWELKLIIRFPPGSTILIPSSIVNHSNTPIGENETRHSFTQYTAGALFRWAANGNKTDDTFLHTASAEQKAQRAAAAETRWEDGVAYFSTLDELQELYGLDK
ncbi:hypothetical protein FB45DRAFT_901407 [Roridomyces roridus]|uniref:Uncharacterized protein n=1 Tax=Roridomyces roridus TaxID=1738132 RepID=A0AAD7FVY5_9AGAR|nr:hypothetical protein FB45DRAFT_901407 [Roridomyces roridus]